MTNLELPLFGSLAWIDVVVLGWFALTATSVVYVALDTWRNPEMTVMKWGWVLVTLYMGPISAGLYIFADKEPRPGAHEEYIRPLWRQGLGEATVAVFPTLNAFPILRGPPCVAELRLAFLRDPHAKLDVDGCIASVPPIKFVGT